MRTWRTGHEDEDKDDDEDEDANEDEDEDEDHGEDEGSSLTEIAREVIAHVALACGVPRAALHHDHVAARPLPLGLRLGVLEHEAEAHRVLVRARRSVHADLSAAACAPALPVAGRSVTFER